MTHRTLRLLATSKTVLAGLLASSAVFAATTIGTNISTDGTLTVIGNAGIGDTTPDSTLTVRGAVAPTGTLFEVTNANNSSRYFTVASTSTRVVAGRFETAGHANDQGLLLPTNAGSPVAVTGTAEGDIVWDSTGNGLYVYDGTSFVQMNAAASTPTLEQTYNAATSSVEFGLNSAKGALTISNAIGGLGINGNLFEIQNRTTTGGGYDTRYFTVSATSTQILNSRLISPAHANSQGFMLPTNAGAPVAVTGTAEGDVVWDSTGNGLYVYDGASFVQMNAAASTPSLNQTYLAATSTTELFLSPSRGALSLADTFSGTGNIFEVQNRLANDAYSSRYLTVSSTSTQILNSRLISPAHANSQGFMLPTNGGAPAAVTGTTEGDIVWDSTGNALYVYDGSAFSQVGGSASTPTLEQAYNAATSTVEIGLNSTKGGLTISNSIGGIGIKSNLFEIQNRTTTGGGYNQRYFTVSTTSTGILTNSPTAALTVQNPNDTGGTVLDLRLSSGSVFSVDYQGNIVASRTLSLARSAHIALEADEFWPFPALEIAPTAAFATNLIEAKTGATPRFIVEADGDVQLTAGINTQDGTGSVAANAVTVSTTSGVITDPTDINTDTTRAAITWTNTRIATTSVVTASICSTPDAGARLGVAVTPGNGSATVTVYNSGTSNQTSDYKICFQVTN